MYKRYEISGNGVTREEEINLDVGDKLYRITDIGIVEEVVKEIDGCVIKFYSGTQKYISCSRSKLYFNSKELAEKELDLMNKTKQKKKLLREYEEKLNKELGLTEFIVKV